MNTEKKKRSGLYQIRLQWARIKNDIDMGKTRKQIYEELKEEKIYDYTYQAFSKTIERELNISGPKVKADKKTPPTLLSGPKDVFSTPECDKEQKEISDAVKKFTK